VHPDAMVTLPDGKDADIIDLDIPLGDLPDYWRYAAGGTIEEVQGPGVLEARAFRADVCILVSRVLVSCVLNMRGRHH